MKSLLTICFVFTSFLAQAQLHKIAESTPFEEPEDGYGRILALKNGGNAYIHITDKDGIEVKLYDAAHTQTVSKTVKPDYGKLKAAGMEGAYEANNEIALFISEFDGRTPTLYRVRINETTGDLIELATVGTLKDVNLGQAFAMSYGDVPQPGFKVRQDAVSGSTSAILYNTFESDRTRRVELVQMNAEGAETGRAWLSSPEAKYKFTNVLDLAVAGNTTYVLIYSYNTASSGGNESDLLLATVTGGKVTYNSIGNSYKNHIESGLLRYNPVSSSLIFLTSELEKTKNSFLSSSSTRFYTLQFAIINPGNPEQMLPVQFSNGELAAKHQRIFDNDYSPMPQGLYINTDGTFTVLLEMVAQKFAVSNSGSYPSGAVLGNAATITFSESGKEISNSLIPLSHTLLPKMLSQKYRLVSPFYIAERENAAVVLSGGNQFKSFFYLNGKANNYVLENDVEENASLVKKGKLTNIKGVKDCDAWYYNLTTATGDIPARHMLFNRSEPKDHNLAILTMSSYDKERDLFTTLKLENGKVRLAWFTGS